MHRYTDKLLALVSSRKGNWMTEGCGKRENLPYPLLYILNFEPCKYNIIYYICINNADVF